MVLEALTSFWRAVGVTVMWLVACLPVVTAGAATMALVGVVRDTALHRERPVVRSYLAHLRDNARLGTGWLVFTLLPVVALAVTWRQPAAVWTDVLAVISMIGVVAMLPLLVHGCTLAVHTRQPSLRALYRSSVLLAVATPGPTLIGLLMIAAVVVATAVWPGAIIVLGYPVARALFNGFRRGFNAVAVQPGPVREEHAHGLG
ncbi:MAG TPA: DUF624 domain-containing protein [Candidatus Avipropionibacterium avicola]|uniref:DUF624 domain-containing protein n=1 Tax=Candidatus Avipropionibacterium avicola TaxID=2840701 RepID=A0A9D1GXZ9_9ACTN|nr:DUF624 domain-containing protein [Candidatus Avipropionibacterium avicola]